MTWYRPFKTMRQQRIRIVDLERSLSRSQAEARGYKTAFTNAKHSLSVQTEKAENYKAAHEAARKNATEREREQEETIQRVEGEVRHHRIVNESLSDECRKQRVMIARYADALNHRRQLCRKLVGWCREKEAARDKTALKNIELLMENRTKSETIERLKIESNELGDKLQELGDHNLNLKQDIKHLERSRNGLRGAMVQKDRKLKNERRKFRVYFMRSWDLAKFITENGLSLPAWDEDKVNDA